LLEEVSKHGVFQDLVNHLETKEDQWMTWIRGATPEDNIPTGWENTTLEKNQAQGAQDFEYAQLFRNLVVLKILRQDRLNFACYSLIQKLMGERFVDIPQLDLANIVANQSSARSPFLLCSAPGFDASFKIDQLVKETGKKLASVAIGSAEGFEQAEKAISNSARDGSWVLLRNVHLAPQWLQELEKKLFSMQLNANFRLFLAMEFNPKVPSTLVRQSLKFVFEPPEGIKASL